MSSAQETETQELVITYQFNAPRELVWRAWTDPEMVKQWWGPHDFTAPFCEIDLRVGGKMLFCMKSPEGQEIWAGGEFLVVDPPKRLVMTDHFMDKDGNVVQPSVYGMPMQWPDDCKVDLTFEEEDGVTTMTMRQGPIPGGEMAEGANEGWSQSFEKLEKLLAA